MVVMKKSIVLSLAAMVLLASCEKEISVPEVIVNPDDATTVLRIGIPETKTTLGALDGSKRKVYWSNGDKIAVNGNESEALSGVAEGSTVAEFHFASPQAAPFNILYPASIWKDASTVTLPAEQAFVSGSFADGSCPMAGYSADGQAASLKYLCAVVKLPIKKASDSHNIASVSFASSGSEKVCGDFSINYENGTISGGSGSAVSVKVGQALSADAALDVYVVVPAATYASGFKLTITDVQNHEMVKAKEGSVTLEAGHIYNLEEVEFKPDIAPTVLNISSAEALIQLAMDYNSAKYLGQPLTVNLTSDITFNSTTSAAFAATGGIGSIDNGQGDTNYFDGTFNGNNKTIKGYAGSAPIFAYIGGSGVVKDLVIDSSCSFTFSHNNEADAYFAAVAGYHKGVIDNVDVAAKIALAAKADIAKITALGGIAGRVTTGSVTNCSYSGAISVPAGFASSAKILVGGVAGYMSNANGSVTASSFDGTIEFMGVGANKEACNEDKNNPFVVIGGVVGYKAGGLVANCTTSDHPVIAGAYNNTLGTIVDKGTIAWVSAIGGIVGENVGGEVNSCTNGAQVLVTIFKDQGSDDQARRIWTGGIVGVNRADGVVTGCLNNAALVHRSNPRLQCFGGIVGNNLGTVTTCANAAALSMGTSGTGSYSARCPNFGGIIGENAKGAVVSDVHNTGDLLISRTENTTGTEVRFGGVIGTNYAAIDGGASKNITNSGQVYYNTNITNQAIKYSLGGIVGYSEASISGVANSGYVLFNWASDANIASLVHLGGVVGYMKGAAELELSGCDNIGGASNAGEVNLAVKGGKGGHTGNYAGGILGYGETAVAISNCTNSGYVHGGNTTKVNGKTFVVGGIAAYLVGGSSVSSCTNKGILLNNQFNNTATKEAGDFEGGIVGMAVGTAEARISLSNLTNDVPDVTTIMGGRRGYTGGIAGYCEYADIANSACADSYGGGSCWYIGGIAGWALNSTINGCSFTGTSISTSQIQANGGGGIVARAEASTISSCNSSITDIYHVNSDGVKDADVEGGAIIGVADAGNTVSGCHYKAAINGSASNIAGTGEFTDGGGNAADL